jgi:hypothetical protein
MSPCATELERLPGLTTAKNAIKRALAGGSGVHAVLLYGPRGAGKERLARLLACSWMCASPVEGIACGECNVCKAFAAGRAVDFQHYYPWGPSSQIKLSSMHPTVGWEQDKERPDFEFIQHFFRTRPLMARQKVVLMTDAHRMNPDAANAFLKTLEEPNPCARIVLATDEFTRVLPTIRSRCMCLACEVPVPAASDPVEAAFGATPGDAERVREHPEVFAALLDVLERSRTSPWGAAFKLAEECRGVAEDYARATKLGARAANAAVLELVAAWLAKERPERPELLKAAAEAHRRVLGNVNAPPVFEDLFLDLLYHG